MLGPMVCLTHSVEVWQKETPACHVVQLAVQAVAIHKLLIFILRQCIANDRCFATTLVPSLSRHCRLCCS